MSDSDKQLEGLCDDSPREADDARRILDAYRQATGPRAPAGAAEKALAVAHSPKKREQFLAELAKEPREKRRIIFHPGLAAAAGVLLVVTLIFINPPSQDTAVTSGDRPGAGLSKAEAPREADRIIAERDPQPRRDQALPEEDKPEAARKVAIAPPEKASPMSQPARAEMKAVNAASTKTPRPRGFASVHSSLEPQAPAEMKVAGATGTDTSRPAVAANGNSKEKSVQSVVPAGRPENKKSVTMRQRDITPVRTPVWAPVEQTAPMAMDMAEKDDNNAPALAPAIRQPTPTAPEAKMETKEAGGAGWLAGKKAEQSDAGLKKPQAMADGEADGAKELLKAEAEEMLQERSKQPGKASEDGIRAEEGRARASGNREEKKDTLYVSESRSAPGDTKRGSVQGSDKVKRFQSRIEEVRKFITAGKWEDAAEAISVILEKFPRGNHRLEMLEARALCAFKLDWQETLAETLEVIRQEDPWKARRLKGTFAAKAKPKPVAEPVKSSAAVEATKPAESAKTETADAVEVAAEAEPAKEKPAKPKRRQRWNPSADDYDR